MKVTENTPAVPVMASPLYVATPPDAVVAVGLLNVPAPLVMAAVIVTPAVDTALPLASRSWITGCGANGVPLVTGTPGIVVNVSCVPLPATAVAVNVTGLPLNPAAAAVIVYVCAVVPSVHAFNCAIPEAFVVTVTLVPDVLALATEEPAVTAVKVTTVPDTGLPVASATSTDGTVGTLVPTVAVWLLPAFSAMVVAAPDPMAMTPNDAGV